MQNLRPLEIGVVFWAGQDPAESINECARLGLRCGQLGIPGDLDLRCAPAWRNALVAADFNVYTLCAAFTGENYTDMAAVQSTVGFIPRASRAEREERMIAVSDFAAALGIFGLATHIGFVPEDPHDPDYIGIRELVRRVCDHAARHGQTFALETGQERALVLLDFIHDVNRENLGINFDPANMILYGTGDPVEALGQLAAHVLSVHCKDGDWPDKSVPGALGVERPLGEGAVGIGRFIEALRHIGYRGPLAIERETSDSAQRMRDIESAVALLRRFVP